MNLNNNEKKKGKLNSFFSDTIQLEGDVKFAGSVRVDGQIVGNIHCDSTIYAGKFSKIDAEIETGSLVCEGNVVGNVFAHEGVHLTAIGKLKGSVKTPDFTVEDNGYFEGFCQVLKPKALEKKFFNKFPKRPIKVLDE